MTDRVESSKQSAEPARVGIIGGGQLGWLLCRAARALGLRTVVLAPEAECPAAEEADRMMVGAFDDVGAARRLAAEVDVVTFEIESIAPEVLRVLDDLDGSGSVRVRPAPRIMLLLQNKVLQKQWLAEQGIPTPDFVVLSGTEPDAEKRVARLGLPLVQKAAVGGYDGRGVQIMRDKDALADLWPVAGLAEVFVPEAREISVVVARAEDGSVAGYPPVSMRFEARGNVLDAVLSPATVPEAVSRRATALAEDLVKRLDGVGVFAIEMFVTLQDEVLVNEISPRVHNSGHLTLEAAATSQFEQHLRAVTGRALGPTDQPEAAVMKNLLYGDDLAHLLGTGAVSYFLEGGQVAVHWYGKRQGSPLRKMGHITALGKDVRSADARAQRARLAMGRVAEGMAP